MFAIHWSFKAVFQAIMSQAATIPSSTRRRFIAGAAASLALYLKPSPSQAQNARAGATKSSGKLRNIAWEELVPKDWDPFKPFEGIDLGSLQDSDPKAKQLLQRMRQAWDNAPTNPQLAGALVRIPGFIVPLEQDAGGLKEFLLVPYFGACIHTPPPPANQMIHVKLQTPAPGFRSMDTIWVSGTLNPTRQSSDMGVSGYQMNATKVEPYLDSPPIP